MTNKFRAFWSFFHVLLQPLRSKRIKAPIPIVFLEIELAYYVYINHRLGIEICIIATTTTTITSLLTHSICHAAGGFLGSTDRLKRLTTKCSVAANSYESQIEMEREER